MNKKLILGGLAAVMLLPLASCKNDDNKATLVKTDYTLNHSGSTAIAGENLEGLSWTSDNEFVGYVEGTVIKGMYVGETTIKSNKENLSFKLTVAPQYNLYVEPIDQFGKTYSELIAALGAPTYEEYNEENGTTVVIFEVDNEVNPLDLYTFVGENPAQTGANVYAAGAYIDDSVSANVSSDLMGFLTERYVTIDVDAEAKTAHLCKEYGQLTNPVVSMTIFLEYDLDLEGWLATYALPETKAAQIKAQNSMAIALKHFMQK